MQSYLQSIYNFFDQLRRLYEAGIPLPTSVQQASSSLSKLPLLQVERLTTQIHKGQPLAQAMHNSEIFAPLDIHLIEAGEASGNLEKPLSFLMKRYQQKIEAIKQLKSQLTYPLVLLVCALFVAPFPDFILGHINSIEYILRTLGLLLTFAFLIFILFKYWQRFIIKEKHPSLLRILYRRIPIVSVLFKKLSMEEYFECLYLMSKAGTPLIESTQKAWQITDNPFLARAGQKVSLMLRSRHSLYDAFKSQNYFSNQDLQFIQTSEQTGTYEQGFYTLAKKYHEESRQMTKNLTLIIPKIVYFAVVFYVAWSVISSYLARFEEIYK